MDRGEVPPHTGLQSLDIFIGDNHVCFCLRMRNPMANSNCGLKVIPTIVSQIVLRDADSLTNANANVNANSLANVINPDVGC